MQVHYLVVDVGVFDDDNDDNGVKVGKRRTTQKERRLGVSQSRSSIHYFRSR